MPGIQPLDLFAAYLVIAPHLDLLPQFAQILNQVVGEGIVIVEDEDHADDSLSGKTFAKNLTTDEH
jgi:hypothetical protein